MENEADFISKGINDLNSIQISSTVSSLNLHCNLLVSLTGLPRLTNLRELNLSSNEFISSDLPELSFLPSLRLLDLSANRIDSLRSLPFLPGLRTLIVAFNNLQCLGGVSCENVPDLESIDARGNFITCLPQLKSIVHLRKLRELSLGGRQPNPVCQKLSALLCLFDDCSSLQYIDNIKKEEWIEVGASTSVKYLDSVQIEANSITESAEFQDIVHNTNSIPNENTLEYNDRILTPKFDQISKRFKSQILELHYMTEPNSTDEHPNRENENVENDQSLIISTTSITDLCGQLALNARAAIVSAEPTLSSAFVLSNEESVQKPSDMRTSHVDEPVIDISPLEETIFQPSLQHISIPTEFNLNSVSPQCEQVTPVDQSNHSSSSVTLDNASETNQSEVELQELRVELNILANRFNQEKQRGDVLTRKLRDNEAVTMALRVEADARGRNLTRQQEEISRLEDLARSNQISVDTAAIADASNAQAMAQIKAQLQEALEALSVAHQNEDEIQRKFVECQVALAEATMHIVSPKPENTSDSKSDTDENPYNILQSAAEVLRLEIEEKNAALATLIEQSSIIISERDTLLASANEMSDNFNESEARCHSVCAVLENKLLLLVAENARLEETLNQMELSQGNQTQQLIAQVEALERERDHLRDALKIAAVQATSTCKAHLEAEYMECAKSLINKYEDAKIKAENFHKQDMARTHQRLNELAICVKRLQFSLNQGLVRQASLEAENRLLRESVLVVPSAPPPSCPPLSDLVPILPSGCSPTVPQALKSSDNDISNHSQDEHTNLIIEDLRLTLSVKTAMLEDQNLLIMQLKAVNKQAKQEALEAQDEINTMRQHCQDLEEENQRLIENWQLSEADRVAINLEAIALKNELIELEREREAQQEVSRRTKSLMRALSGKFESYGAEEP